MQYSREPNPLHQTLRRLVFSDFKKKQIDIFLPDSKLVGKNS